MLIELWFSCSRACIQMLIELWFSYSFDLDSVTDWAITHLAKFWNKDIVGQDFQNSSVPVDV